MAKGQAVKGCLSKGDLSIGLSSGLSSRLSKGTLYIEGIVQGIGFRPFVARLARTHGLTGSVQNVQGHVQAEVYGPETSVQAFFEAVPAQKPQGSFISRMDTDILPLALDGPVDETSSATLAAALGATLGEAVPSTFVILESTEGTGRVMPSPDLSLCEDCARELFTPGDSRYRNPFISCTHCGPRFSILQRIPYDRATISMKGFPLCPACQAQYREPSDRRYHAQTVCCNDCGPTLRYMGRGTKARGEAGNGAAASGRAASSEAALSQVVAALKADQIIAVKGIGGYHLVCSPFAQEAVEGLRLLKGREHKPFAVMFEGLTQLEAYCIVSSEEAELLQSPARPIVLLQRKAGAPALAPGVCNSSPFLGAFLPYTPLQLLLLRETGLLIMTSANPSSLPIFIDDAAMEAFFCAHPQLFGVLSHDRPILRRLDDSVGAVIGGKPAFLRRARGYVPRALPLPPGPALLGCGPQEKNTFCLAQNGYGFLSTEIGDMDSQETLALYRETITDMEALLSIEPEYAVCDMHPGYESTLYGQSLGLPVIAVQHHHAHIASAMAEHGLTRPVIGVAFDGTGYGPDGTLWGGEFLLATPEGYTRLGHLAATPFLGGDLSIRQGWKSAACLLHSAGVDIRSAAALTQHDPQGLVHAALTHGVNTLRSSSMGRVFDGVSALLGICDTSHYGGQCAIELEYAATVYQNGNAEAVPPLPFLTLAEAGQQLIDLTPCYRELYALKQRGHDPGLLALRFHKTIAEVIVQMSCSFAQKTGIRDIALSGGVFNNRLLLEEAVPRLTDAGLTVYRNQQVPSGDGGLALGQAYIALAQLSKGVEV